LTHNGKEIYRLAADEGIQQRIARLFSPEIAQGLIETESVEKDLRISAYLGKPGISRTNNKLQYVFLNGRFIRDKFISHAFKEAYRGCLDASRYPAVFLFIQMPYDDYDVNVHPTKIEVRFYNANLVHSQILGCMREKLLGCDLDIEAKLPDATEKSQNIRDAMSEFFQKHRPGHTQQQFSFRPPAAMSSGHEQFKAALFSEPQIPLSPSPFFEQRKFLQIHDSFILVQTDEGFMIIDQHALHERIMYEDLSKRVKQSNLESQKLLIPESFEITEAQAQAVEDNARLFERLGIELVQFGPKIMAVQAFPTLLAKADPLNLVQDLLDMLTNTEVSPDPDRLLDKVLHMAACKAAIKAGQKLSDREIDQLLEIKDVTESSSRSPHGRPTTIKFSIAELEKQFKRT
ncbi:MAG: hypothetical protein E4H40_02570, partial [Candidatus Brocadiia bacterium]